jgi:hypothetical protein
LSQKESSFTIICHKNRVLHLQLVIEIKSHIYGSSQKSGVSGKVTQKPKFTNIAISFAQGCKPANEVVSTNQQFTCKPTSWLKAVPLNGGPNYLPCPRHLRCLSGEEGHIH